MSTEPDPSLADIDALLRFLPTIEQPDFDPGRMHPAAAPGEEGHDAPYFEASPEMEELILALHQHGWVSDFDWSEWQTVAERYAKNPTLLKEAGLGTLRKLFTTHVQREKFCDGHLAEVARSGHLAALLRRLHEIRGGLQL